MTSTSQAPDSAGKVAIIGGAESRNKAPYDDPSWDIWAFSSLRVHTPGITRWFEMHALGDLKEQLRRDTRYRRSYRTYLKFLRQLDCPVFMQRTHKAIPNSVEYPLNDALNAFGKCFTSTPSYLIALAIMERYATIGLWGVRLVARRVDARQQPGVEYLLGVAGQKGINVYLPAGCPLRVPKRPKPTRTDILYGYDWKPPKARGHKKRRRKVAIVGGGPSRRKAPFKNRSWDIWAFSSRRARYPRITRWFELHATPDLRQQLATAKRGRRTFRHYRKLMRHLKCPVYMQKVHRDIPNSVAFPKKAVVKKFGPVFSSTASYLIALAIMEGYDVIGLWGIDVKGKEYKRQRPAIRYLLGVARKKGIRVYVPRRSSLRVPKKPGFVKTRALYAYDWRSRHAWWRARVRRRLRIRRRLHGRRR